jgi:lysophospholipase L1-like esterase
VRRVTFTTLILLLTGSAFLLRGPASARLPDPVRVARTPVDEPATVTLIGDSLTYRREALYEDAFAREGIPAHADGRGSRALRWGWQCRNAAGRLAILSAPNAPRCRMEGLELLRALATPEGHDGVRLGREVVLALGTNDSGLFTPTQANASLDTARTILGDRRVFLVSIVKPGSSRAVEYDATTRDWCRQDKDCVFVEWATSPAAGRPEMYNTDGVHLTEQGARARAAFIAATVAASR